MYVCINIKDDFSGIWVHNWDRKEVLAICSSKYLGYDWIHCKCDSKRVATTSIIYVGQKQWSIDQNSSMNIIITYIQVRKILVVKTLVNDSKFANIFPRPNCAIQ